METVRQESGLRCQALLLRFHQISADPSKIAHEKNVTTRPCSRYLSAYGRSPGRGEKIARIEVEWERARSVWRAGRNSAAYFANAIAPRWVTACALALRAMSQ